MSPHYDVLSSSHLHSIPVLNHNNLQYYTNITVGDHQKFNVVLDTGSDKLWVPSSDCHSAVCKQHHRFDESKSDTFVRSHDSMRLRYGTGQVAGRTGQDTVSLGDLKKLEEYPIAVSTEITEKPFSSLKPIDGIFGIGKGTKFSENEKLFSFYLSNDTKTSGSLSLGAIDKNHINPTSPITYHPTIQPGSWTIKLVDVKVGDQRMHVCGDKGCAALIDTGSSLITGPPNDINNILKSQGIHQTCSGYNQGPSKDITLIFQDQDGNETEYPLSSKEYSIDFQDDAKECKLGIGPLDMGNKRWVIGDTFLRRYVSLFDKEHHRIGFVKSRHDNEDIGVLSRGVPITAGIALKSVMRTVRARTVGITFLFCN